MIAVVLIRANLYALKPQAAASHGGDSARHCDTSFEGSRVTFYLIEFNKVARKQKKHEHQGHWWPSYVGEEKGAEMIPHRVSRIK